MKSSYRYFVYIVICSSCTESGQQGSVGCYLVVFWKAPGEDAPGQVDFPEAPPVSVCWKVRKQENHDEASVIQLTDISTSVSTDAAASQLQVSYNQTSDTCPQRREKGLHWEDNCSIALLSTIQGLHSRAVNISKSLLKPEKQQNKAISFFIMPSGHKSPGCKTNP